MRCLIIDSNKWSIEILEAYLNKVEGIEIIGTFSNVLDAIPLLNKDTTDLVFLDVEKQYLLNIKFAEEKINVAQFVLTSFHGEFRIDAYKLNATAYLTKPITFDIISLAILKAKRRYKNQMVISVNIFPAGPEYQNEKTEDILIKTEKGILRVDVNEIKFIQIVKGISKIYTKNNRIPIICSTSKENFLINLPDYFLQVNNSFVINSILIDAVQKKGYS